MCAILVGPLDSSFLRRPFLIYLTHIVQANKQLIHQFVVSALVKFLGEQLDYQEVRLFLTDAAAYCLKAGRGLKNLFRDMCIPQPNRVAEMVCYTFQNVDKLVSEVKKIFVKSTRRRTEFAAACKILLPPEPVLTR